MTHQQQTPAVHHITIRRGDFWQIDVAVNFDADPADLTGYTVAGVIHPKDGSANVNLTVTPLDLSAGTFRVSLPAATSATLALAHHYWHLTVTPPGTPAKPRQYIAGRFIVEDCV